MENPDSAVWEHFAFSTDFRDGRRKKRCTKQKLHVNNIQQ